MKKEEKEEEMELINSFISKIRNKIEEIRYSEEERLDMLMDRVFSQGACLKIAKDKDIIDFFDYWNLGEQIAQLRIVRRGVDLMWFPKYSLAGFQEIGIVLDAFWMGALQDQSFQALRMLCERKKKLPSEILKKYQIAIVSDDRLDGVVYIREKNLQQAVR